MGDCVMTRHYVAVESDGVVEVHLPAISDNYATLCGLDGDDSKVGQRPAVVPRGTKVNCPQCQAIFELCKSYSRKDFELAVSRKTR